MKNILALLSILFLLTGCSSSEPDYVPPTARMSDFESDESGFNSKTVFYDNGHEVVVFDTQLTTELAEKAIDSIRSQTEHPIKYVVITHPNPEKFNGAEAFKKIGAKIIASGTTVASLNEVHQYKKNYFIKVAKSHTSETYPSLSRPDVVFEGKYTIKLANSETIELRELSKSGVSSNQTVAYVPNIESLVVGDLISYKSHAWLEGGIYQGTAVAKIKNWIADLNELNTLFGEKNPMVYGGRGQAGKLSDVLPAQESYLTKVDEVVAEYVSDLAARGKKKRDLTDPEAAARHHAILQGKIEALFPGYQNGYLIKSSIYGLVNTK